MQLLCGTRRPAGISYPLGRNVLLTKKEQDGHAWEIYFHLNIHLSFTAVFVVKF